MRVLVADKLPSVSLQRLERSGFEVTQDATLKGESLVAKMNATQPEILVVRSTRVEAEHFAASASLALVIRAGAGVNTIDLATGSAKGFMLPIVPVKMR